MLCEEIEIEEKIYVTGNYNYVFAAIDPKDNGYWIFSCSCHYNENEVKSFCKSKSFYLFCIGD